MLRKSFPQIKLVDNCSNNICIFLTGEKPQKRILLITLCSEKKGIIPGTISNVRLLNPNKPNTFVTPLTLKDLSVYPEVYNKVLKFKPSYSSKSTSKYFYEPMSYIFDVSEFIYDVKRLRLFYTTNTGIANRQLKLKFYLHRAIRNSCF